MYCSKTIMDVKLLLHRFQLMVPVRLGHNLIGHLPDVSSYKVSPVYTPHACQPKQSVILRSCRIFLIILTRFS